MRWDMQPIALALLLWVPTGSRCAQGDAEASAGSASHRRVPETKVADADERVAGLVIKLAAGDLESRRQAARALCEMGLGAKTAVPALIEAAQGKDDLLQYWACKALGSIGPEAGEGSKVLIARLSSPHIGIRIAASKALRRIGPTAGPGLLVALRSKNPHVRSRAAYALGKCSTGVKDAVPRLAEALEDDDDEVRRGAAFALGELGAPAKGSAPRLLRLLKGDKSVGVREIAAWALGELGKGVGHIGVPLTQSLKDPNERVRAAAAEALAGFGAMAVGPLKEALRDSSALVRVWAAYALVQIDPNGSVSVEYIAEMAESGFPDVGDMTAGAAAVEALGKLGPSASDAIPTLMELLPRGGIVANVVTDTLERIGLAAIRQLEKAATQDKRPEMREAAAKALELIRKLQKEPKPRSILDPAGWGS